ncbi:podoplanin isoform X1 [Larimichthys crocea]|uniref:podoplanin isoform X1 n=1 Tax=Larimichthys crocea TaxID=215358 RepID=UPI000901F059|nr:lysine-rich arabinogalactan protein 19 isoform X1 [Larimichthys crocea]
MNVQLLLLLALVGPFCAFTHASPTALPTEVSDMVTATETDISADATAAPDTPDAPATQGTLDADLSIVTGPPATEPAAAPEEVATEVVTEAAPPAVTVNTEEAIVETVAPTPAAATNEAPEPLITDPPIVETAAPTMAGEAEVVAEVTEKSEDVLLTDDTPGDLSYGQIVGIVIGALLAVVIVIAVVIAVVRRMGKYSSAKNKKPAKKDSVMVSPLRKKSAKQQERPKFWKF